MPRTILIVDDSAAERTLLSDCLHNEYDILAVENSKAMFATLREKAQPVSAVLLGLSAPGADGFDALSALHENAAYRRIPVVAVTEPADEAGQARALSLGASGYVPRRCGKELLLCTLASAIALREETAPDTASRVDSLTGLLNRTTFFETAEAMIRREPAGYYMLACFDIENFKIINDQYGVEAGDALLKRVADTISRGVQALGGACCRYSADKFGMLYPVKWKDSEMFADLHEKVLFGERPGHAIRIRIGRYLVDDPSVPVSAMYDRATLAEESIRGRYDTYIAEYSDSMRMRLLREQEIANDMSRALADGEFEPWLQPQYNHATGALIGAEALARWKKDGKHLSPAEFIPVFEHNGFIYEMDQYIWESVLKLLRRWLDEGRAPLPVSVNISRRDLLHTHFTETLTGLVKKYDIPYDLLRLEVTESAFAEASGQIVRKVVALINMGFVVEIDDFGSGYSSLNTLKDVPASILKLDMKFFENTENRQRGGNIVESVIRMSRWLGMAVIAEGVEDWAQADYLRSIGCYYIQGYCYAKPMPVAEYEKLLFAGAKEPELGRLKTLETLDNNEFWNPKSMETLIFNSYIGGACIFEYRNGKSELLRTNEQYARELHGLVPAGAHLQESSLVRFLDAESKETLGGALKKAIAERKEAACEIRLSDKAHIEYVRATVRLIAHAADRYLFYCVIENVTEQRELADKLDSDHKTMASLLDNLPCGAALYEYDGKRLNVIHINKSYWRLVSREPTDYGKTSVFNVIHPDDRPIVRQEMDAAIRQKRNIDIHVRILCGESTYKPFRIVANVTPEDSGEYLFFTSYTPVSEQAMSIQEMLPVALSTMMSASEDLSYVKDRDLHYVCCSQSVADLLGLGSVRDIIGKTDFDLFDRALAAEFVALDKRIVAHGESSINFTEKLPGKNGGVRLVNTSKYPLMDAGGNVIGLYGVSRDITAQREKESQLELLAGSIPGGIAAYSISEKGIRMQYFNDGFYRFSGYSREEYARIVEEDPLAFVFEEDRPQIQAMIRGFGEHKTDSHVNGCVFRCRAKDGGYRWMSMKTVLSKRSESQYIVNVVQTDITEQQEEKERLRISEEFNRLAIEQSGNIITRFDVKSRTLTLPDAFNPIFVLPQVLNNMPEEQIALNRVSPDTADIYRELFNGIVRGSAAGTATYKQNSSKGWRWLLAQYTTVFANDGKPVSAVISFTDITEKLEKEVVYNKWQQSLDERPEDSYTLFRCNLSKGAAFDSREGKLLRFGFDDPSHTFDERSAAYAEQCVYEEDRGKYRAFLYANTLLAEYYRGHRSDTLEYRESGADGAVRWLRLTVDLVEYPSSRDIEAYLMYEDIDEQKRAELLTLERSENDPLTGILNRATFISRMEDILETSAPGATHALFMLDVDNFKFVNDTLGHGAGDQVLRDLTGKIGAILRRGDLIGRLGGDEFFVFLKDIPGADAAAAKARQICELKIPEPGSDAIVTASIGIAMIPGDGSSFDTLYKKVDAALYRQKERGKNGFLFA